MHAEPVAAGPGLDLAAVDPYAFAHPDQSTAGPVDRTRQGGRPVRTRSRGRRRRPLRGSPALRRDAGPDGVAQGVGERLLEDAVRREVHSVRQCGPARRRTAGRRRARRGRARPTSRAASRKPRGSARSAVGLRWVRRRGRSSRAPRGRRAARSGSIDRRAGLPADTRPRMVRGQLGLTGLGLDHHDADAVRDHVVHVAGDPGPLLGHQCTRLHVAARRSSSAWSASCSNQLLPRPDDASCNPERRRPRPTTKSRSSSGLPVDCHSAYAITGTNSSRHPRAVRSGVRAATV